MRPRLEQILLRGAAQLEVELTGAQRDALMAYLDLFQKWNKAYNLTAVRDPEQMVIRHLLDSLAIAPYIEADRYIDVGTGGGLPGVPMAILFPDRRFDLLDSNGKKTRFLFQVKTALALDNMTVHHARVEAFRPEQTYDVVLSRAFASLLDMVTGCRHLLEPGGHFLAMKGTRPDDELAALPFDDCRLQAIHTLAVPGLDEQRHLVDLLRC